MPHFQRLLHWPRQPQKMSDSQPAALKRKRGTLLRQKSSPKLRDLPLSQSAFCKAELDEYLAQKVCDTTHDSTNDRILPPNEIDALGLNEIAVSKGEGYFFFLPNRNSWGKQSFDPKSRGPTGGLG